MNEENEAKMRERLPAAKLPPGFSQCGDGWFDLLYTTILVLPDGVSIREAKEKYGRLSLFTGCAEGISDEDRNFAKGVVVLAEAMSLRICDQCGARGTVLRDRWVRVRCDEHAAL
jgi:hypothetical protein